MPTDKIKELFDEIIEGIHSGEITELDLPEGLYRAIADKFIENVEEGYEGELLDTLIENVEEFSAAKVFQQVSELSDVLHDSEGARRSLEDFKTFAEPIWKQYNENWQDTEETTARATSESIGKFEKIYKEKDKFPTITFRAIDTACDICAPLDGITLPVDDEFWDEMVPPIHFNCYCYQEQNSAEDEVPETNDDDVADAYSVVNPMMNDEFKRNPYKDEEVFSSDHPYFDVPKEYEEFKNDNFGLPLTNYEE